jgi:hypothetical protein
MKRLFDGLFPIDFRVDGWKAGDCPGGISITVASNISEKLALQKGLRNSGYIYRYERPLTTE